MCKLLAIFIFGFSLIFVVPGKATGLEDLNKALSNLTVTEDISGEFKVRFETTEGEEKDKKIRNGSISLKLQETSEGLALFYSNATLKALETENKAKLEDSEADTPTLNAISSFDAYKIKNVLNAVHDLKRTLVMAEFIGEDLVVFNYKPVRRLTFNLPLDSVITDKQVREFVDEFKSIFYVLIDDEGVPLQTTNEYKGKGRAYVVLSVTAYGKTTVSYSQINGRLIKKMSESHSNIDSTFGKQESVEIQEFVVSK